MRNVFTVHNEHFILYGGQASVYVLLLYDVPPQIARKVRILIKAKSIMPHLFMKLDKTGGKNGYL